MAYDLIKVSGLPLVTPDSGQDIVVGVGDYAKRINYNAVKADMVGISPSYTTDTEPYLMRRTAHTGVVGKCALEKLVGGSLGWNQLCKYPTTQTVSGVTVTNSGTKLTLNGTATALIVLSLDTLTIPTHIYYADKGSYATNYRLYNSGNGVTTGDEGRYCLGKASGSTALTLRIPSGSTFANLDIVPQAIDLTQMFGSTIADYVYGLGQTSGIAWLSKYIDLSSYHAYDAGSTQSVQTTAHVTTDKNLLENTTATQTVNGITFTRNEDGSVTANGIASANAQYSIDIDTSKIYGDLYFNGVSGGSSTTYQIYMWDSTTSARPKKWNGTTNSGDSVNLTTLQEVKVPQGHTVTLVCRVVSGTTVSNVRFYPMLTYPSNTDPTYEPYTAHTYPLGSDTLRGYPMLVSNKLAFDGDIKTPDGTITRKYGYVDMGSLTWAYDSTYQFFYTNSLNSSMKQIWPAVAEQPIVCGKYAKASFATDLPDAQWNSVASGTIAYHKNGENNVAYIYVKDTAYTSAATFKTAMSGVYLVYPLKTETTESSTAYQKVQTIDADGTESFTTTTPVPVGHETQTADNVLAALGWLGE